jgi:hypothetical protein
MAILAKIYNGETAMAKGKVSLKEETVVIGATMGNYIRIFFD